jgi:hypothetical protein
MPREQLAQKQYEQAKQAAGKLEDWRLHEIRYELRIADTKRSGASSAAPKASSKK